MEGAFFIGLFQKKDVCRVIILEEIHKEFDSARERSKENFHALKGVSITVPAGSVFGVIGRSGAGKSTLIRTINLLERPTSGRVIIDGVDMTALSEAKLREARKSIGMIFQSFNLLSSLTAAGNVAFPLKLAGWGEPAITARVDELLELVELSDKKNDYPARLSGGQKQRVGIARALAAGPKILLCDEPTSALDPQTTRSILELLRAINRKLGLTVVLITHEMSVIKQICDEVVVLEDGLVAESGTVFEVFTRPRAAITRELISSIMARELPPHFADMNFMANPTPGSTTVLRVSFLGDTAATPVISGMIRQCNVDANIIYGAIDHIQSVPYGTLVLELSGGANERDAAMDYLRNLNLGLEVIGYVRRDTNASV